MKRFLLFAAGAVFMLSSCKQKDYTSEIHDPSLYREVVKKLNDVILENGFPPVVASRNYAYANIAAYEVIAAGDSMNYKTLAGQIKHLKQVPRPKTGQTVDFHFAALLAFLKVGNAVTFPEGSMDEYVSDLKKKVRNAGMSSGVFEGSVQYADLVADHILAWSKGDNYAQTRSASKFAVLNEDGRWIPTPPMYAQALEPHWCKIRPMVLDSAAQIVPPPPAPFNMKDKGSTFFKNAMEVKLLGDSLTDEQKHIADFWDDNAFKLNISGHVMFATKKFSPGGHWMNIVGIATQKGSEDFNSTVSLYAETSIALFDAFINCWYVKFQSNYVRPETVINKYLDQDWKPYIQTPPFPEYTSGHAVISAAVAEVLTRKLGDNIAFRDSSQMEFGIKPRAFRSFREAAQEASMSRVYGGIHYVPSCEQGSLNGQKIGQLVTERLQLKKRSTLQANR
jgi:hypothetical protein